MLQKAINDLQRSETTYHEGKKMLKITYNEQILRLFYNLWKSRFPLNVSLQSLEHCFMENHNENSAPNIYILSYAFTKRYKICRIFYEPLGHL